jgi:hypothetical protein
VMTDNVIEIHGARILAIGADGPTLSTDRDAVTLIGDAFGHQATLVLLPTTRLDHAFFDLSTRIAGDFFQKFVNYGMGDIVRRTAESESLRDFVYEANRGDRIWFVASQSELESRLNGSRQA